jgi:hypothetical protein
MIKLTPTASIPGATERLLGKATVTRLTADDCGVFIFNEIQSARGQFNQPQK